MKQNVFFGFTVLSLTLLVGAILVAGCSGTGQEKNTSPGKVWHVGVLSGMSFFADTEDGFREKMAELGYIEGKNIVYDSRKMVGFDREAYKSSLKEFRDNKVDLVFVFPTEASQEAKAAMKGTGIPVVFANVFTEDTGLIESVRQPGGNITGVRWGGPDLALQRYEVMRELVPDAKRLLIPYQRGYPTTTSQLVALRTAASADGITLVEIPVDNTTELTTELNKQAASITGKDTVILAIAEPLFVTPDSFAIIGAFADEHALPAGGAFMSVNGHETVFGLIPRNVPQGMQAAALADKIFRGTPAGEIPVVTADNYFQLNYRQAQKLGLPVSEGLLSRADEIIR
ncbi:MAG TPA: ABC transporter substrate-binding protein [Methanoregula sp.]|nr:ABC transporter substrate-binding protein [Methanoregula sp.]